VDVLEIAQWAHHDTLKNIRCITDAHWKYGVLVYAPWYCCSP
jgi:hypothetical protein